MTRILFWPPPHPISNFHFPMNRNTGPSQYPSAYGVLTIVSTLLYRVVRRFILSCYSLGPRFLSRVPVVDPAIRQRDRGLIHLSKEQESAVGYTREQNKNKKKDIKAKRKTKEKNKQIYLQEPHQILLGSLRKPSVHTFKRIVYLFISFFLFSLSLSSLYVSPVILNQILFRIFLYLLFIVVDVRRPSSASSSCAFLQQCHLSKLTERLPARLSLSLVS